MVHRGSQIDYSSIIPEEIAILFTQDRTPSRGQYNILKIHQLPQHLGLTLTKAFLPLNLEDDRYTDPGPLLDLAVRIKECLTQVTR